MWRTVEEYSLGWRPSTGAGMIYLKFADGTYKNFQPKTVEELAAYGDILRNEKPIYYHMGTGALQTGDEPVGEGELQHY